MPPAFFVVSNTVDERCAFSSGYNELGRCTNAVARLIYRCSFNPERVIKADRSARSNRHALTDCCKGKALRRVLIAFL